MGAGKGPSTTHRDRETQDLSPVPHRMPNPPVLLRVIHLDQPVQSTAQHPLLAVLRLGPAQARDRLLVVAQRLQAVRRPRVDLIVGWCRLRVESAFERVARASRARSRRAEQVPHAQDRSARRDGHRPLLADEDLIDGLAVPSDPDAAAPLRVGHARVPQADGRVVAAGEDEGRVGRDEGRGADVVGVGGKGAELGRRREIEETDGRVGRGRQDLGAGARGELGRVDGPVEVRPVSPSRSLRTGASVPTHCLCARIVRRMARLLMSNTWTRPPSSPATQSLPSVLISPPAAVSLKREMVLTTRFVLGE